MYYLSPSIHVIACMHVFLSAKEPPCKRASGFVWKEMTKEKRNSLGVDASFCPWTDRPNIALRGYPKQANKPNFLFESLNLRWIEYCQDHNISYDTTEVPVNLFTDTRQNCQRQPRDGSIVMLSKSKIYWYQRDRCLISMEHMLHNGWSDNLKFSTLNIPVPGFKELLNNKLTEIPAVVTKKKRRRHKQPLITIGDHAGDGMCLPDLASLMYPVLLACESDLFECAQPRAPRQP